MLRDKFETDAVGQRVALLRQSLPEIPGHGFGVQKVAHGLKPSRAADKVRARIADGPPRGVEPMIGGAFTIPETGASGGLRRPNAIGA
ncbi:hypothetical protein GCM10008171_32120 [Methylopila jiangsuensis]|uniref:Uncharacterized protein n=1 Tax=Methylopila jiangsuensis TaxID=586230 RepID=A0A9W6JKN9_9HYPH|nr:hypothetical protein GCM10008171_32120 [Methylopila jiangsuensis]